MTDFIAQLDPINALADQANGFVWRLKGEGGSASSYVRFDDDERLIVNMSVWTSIDALFSYVYRSGHGKVYADRRVWFEGLAEPPVAIWWVPAGHIPTIEEGRARWECLKKNGPTADAFTFKQRYPSPQNRDNRPWFIEPLK
jgi:hypothetical protein